MQSKRRGSSSSRGARDIILDEMDVSDPELDKIEEELGLSMDDAFDDVRELDAPGTPEEQDGMVGVTRTEREDVVLRYAGNFTKEDIAHEAVHGEMKQIEDELEYLPGNKVENRLYSEFAARVAEMKVGDLETDNGEVAALHHAKTRYMGARSSLEGEVLDEEFDSLYEDHVQAKGMRENADKKQFFDSFEIYREAREDVLAKEAAATYDKADEVNMRELIDPDRETFRQTIEYIREVEQNLLRRI